MDNVVEQIDRSELLNLYSHYESVIKDELDFFFKYLNFYIGLCSALLAATLTGMLSLKVAYPLAYILDSGPILIISLSFLGYKNVRVYYRRFLEALITTFNIKRMLGLDGNVHLKKNIQPPIFVSKYGGGFITKFNREKIRNILEDSEKKGLCAEDVFDKLLRKGDTLGYAKYIFILFALVAIVLGIIIINKMIV
jgi:hypothetical protein